MSKMKKALLIAGIMIADIALAMLTVAGAYLSRGYWAVGGEMLIVLGLIGYLIYKIYEIGGKENG